jgi:hypothetical protein
MESPQHIHSFGVIHTDLSYYRSQENMTCKCEVGLDDIRKRDNYVFIIFTNS